MLKVRKHSETEIPIIQKVCFYKVRKVRQFYVVYSTEGGRVILSIRRNSEIWLMTIETKLKDASSSLCHNFRRRIRRRPVKWKPLKTFPYISINCCTLVLTQWLCCTCCYTVAAVSGATWRHEVYLLHFLGKLQREEKIV